MKRTIIAPALLPGAALDELKAWLAITTTRDDVALTALLRAALDTCEGFTRAVPLEALCEEMLPSTAGWHRLSTQPVRAITALEAIAPDTTRTAVDPLAYQLDIAADGCGQVELKARLDQGRVAVRFTAGLAADWASLPEGLRHGVVRLAAHQYRERDEGGATTPPAAVAALWQPWRRMRLA